MKRIEIRQGAEIDDGRENQAQEGQNLASSPTTTTSEGASPTTVGGAGIHTNVPGGSGSGSGSDGAGDARQGGSSVAATPSGTSTELPQPTIVQFDETNFDSDANGRVFAVQNDKKIFKWNVNSTTTVKDITWYGRNRSEVAFVTDGDVLGKAVLPVSGQAQDPFFQVSDQNATLNLGSDKLLVWYWQEMILKIGWETPAATGYSESGVFTVAQVISGSSEVSDFNAKINTKQGIRGGEDIIFKDSTGPIQGAGPASGGSAGNGGGGGGGGGLSTGAIAGIAVAGAVVLLLIVGGLAWFLLRRRRRNQLKGGLDGQQATSSFIAVKEEAQSRVVESPIARYSDDGQGGARSIQPAPRSTDEHIPPTVSSSGSGADASATQAALSRNIAHLVEDGMTEDEIRRLEEEERHLDAEIERATRGV